jgi:pyridoxine kinase
MAIVLCISSQTARGYIGGSAARIALERLGHQAWHLPSVVLSNHPGHAVFAGEQVPPGRLRAMLDALKANGWIDEIDAVLTGYLPTPEHVGFAESAVAMVRAVNPDATVLCDPIMGDDPGGLYLDESAAAAIRDMLLPLANMITPNRFELEWLAGREVRSVAQAMEAAAALPCPAALVTSLPGVAPETVCNLLRDGSSAWECAVAERPFAPHGAGDLLAALYLGHRLKGAPAQDAFGRAVAGVGKALETSGMADELQLAADPGWADAEPVAVTRIGPD